MQIDQESEQIPFPQRPSSSITPTPTPNDPPWTGWTAFGVWALSVFFTYVIPNIFLVIYLIPKHVPLSDEKQLKDFIFTDEGAVLSLLAPVLLVHFFTVAISWIVVTRFNTFSFFKTLGWKLGGFKIWHAAAIFVGFFLLANFMVSLLGKVETDFDKMLAGSRTAVYLVAFFATFTAPLTEEIVYRGLLYSAFQRKFGVGVAALFATLLFVAVHVPQYSSDASPDYATIIMLLVLSAVLTLIRIRTNNLLPCIILHTLFNALQSVFLIIEPYLQTSETPNPVAAFYRILQ